MDIIEAHIETEESEAKLSVFLRTNLVEEFCEKDGADGFMQHLLSEHREQVKDLKTYMGMLTSKDPEETRLPNATI